MAEERKITTFTTPILIGLLVIASFLVGMFWTKIRYLEQGKAPEEVAQATPPAGVPEEEGAVLGEEEAARLAEAGPVKGDPEAPITIIEFSDFQCPFCAQIQTTLDQIFDTYGDDVKLVFRHYPLPFHENAESAALASMCANEQDNFWEYHDLLFENQEDMTMTNLKKWAADLGLDAEKFNSCLDNQSYKEEINKDIGDAQAVGVSGTPAFFVNGQRLVGAQPFEAFKAVIDAELAK